MDPRSNLTRRSTPEGPMEKRKDVAKMSLLLSLSHLSFPRTMSGLRNNSGKSRPLVPACDQHRFCARPM